MRVKKLNPGMMEKLGMGHCRVQIIGQFSLLDGVIVSLNEQLLCLGVFLDPSLLLKAQ